MRKKVRKSCRDVTLRGVRLPLGWYLESEWPLYITLVGGNGKNVSLITKNFIVHKLPELSSHSFSIILIMAYIFGTMVMDGVRLTLNEGKSVGKPTLKPYINYIYHHAIINQWMNFPLWSSLHDDCPKINSMGWHYYDYAFCLDYYLYRLWVGCCASPNHSIYIITGLQYGPI